MLLELTSWPECKMVAVLYTDPGTVLGEKSRDLFLLASAAGGQPYSPLPTSLSEETSGGFLTATAHMSVLLLGHGPVDSRQHGFPRGRVGSLGDREPCRGISIKWLPRGQLSFAKLFPPPPLPPPAASSSSSPSPPSPFVASAFSLK